MADQITVTVDAEVAELYRQASVADRRKLDLLVNLRLREAAQFDEPLLSVMREVSERARARGLTPEQLDVMLTES